MKTALPAAALLALLVGCAGPPAYREADFLYYQNRPRELLAAYAPAEKDPEVNALVGIDKMLSAAILAQDWAEAERLAELASSRVNIFLGGEKGEKDALSLLGREKEKPFKGEPHERAMADFYLGLLRYRRGEYEGALNAFLSAMNKVRGIYKLPVEKGRARKGAENLETFLYENRFAAFAFFAASACQHIEELEEAGRYLAMAREARPELAGLFEQGMDPSVNIIAVIEAGRAPEKIQVGPRREILSYSRGATATLQGIDVGGRRLGFGRTDELFVQASTLGGRSVDELNRTKATRQEILHTAGFAATMAGAMMTMSDNRHMDTAGLVLLGVGIATMIFSATAIDPSADIRAWSTLPDQIYIALGSAPPGEHTVEIQARGQFGEDQSQRWTGVPIREGMNLLWYRLLPAAKGGAYSPGGQAPPPEAPQVQKPFGKES